MRIYQLQFLRLLAALVVRFGVVTAPAVLLLVVSALPLRGQSLDSLRNLLRRNNPDLQALGYDYRAALAISPQLAQLPDLEIGGGISILPVETRLGPQRARVTVTQMLPWPGTLAAMSKLADARAQPFLEQAAARQLELIYELETGYFGMLAAEAQIAALDTSLTLYASLRQIALVRVENSRGSSVDVYRTDIQANAVSRRIEELRSGQQLAWATIEELVNSELPRVAVPLPDPVGRAVGSDLALANHPLVRIFALQEEISLREVALNGLEARPDFAVGVDYVATGRRTDAEPPGNGRDAILPRVMLRIPISGGKYRAKREEESIRILAISARRQSVVNQLSSAIERAVIAREEAGRQLTFLREQVATSTATLTIARMEYANSRRSFDELLQLQNQLIDYQLGAVDALRNLFNQTAAIDRYLPRR